MSTEAEVSGNTAKIMKNNNKQKNTPEICLWKTIVLYTEYQLYLRL